MKSIVKSLLFSIAMMMITFGAFANRFTSNHNFYGNASGIILRGSLVNFNAEYGRNFFDLNWNASAGAGCDHYDVERSTDGTNYEKVGEVKPGAQQGNYNFRDNFRPSFARNNDLYYRLKQVDLNGDCSYSKVLIARMYNTKSVASLSVTPDPLINDILINVQLKTRSFVSIRLTDNTGNVVMKKEVADNDEFNTYQLDGTHDLKPGMYSLEIIINSNERMTMKLLKS